MDIQSFGAVATTPMERKSLTKSEAPAAGEFKVVMNINKTTITYLKVLAPIFPKDANQKVVAEGIKPGDEIGVLGTNFIQGWAKNELTHEDGTRYILVPLEFILTVKKAP